MMFRFNNCAYDFDLEEFVSSDDDDFTCGYDFEEPTEAEKRYIDNYLRNIFAEEENRITYLDTIRLAAGGVHNPNLIVCYGCGSNGKTVLNNLSEKAFGNYATRIAYHSNVDIENKRLVRVSENTDSMTIKEYLLKGYWTKKLHDEAKYCINKSTLITETCDISTIKLFIPTKIISFNNQFEINMHFNDEFYKRYKYAFIWHILTKKYLDNEMEQSKL